MIKEGRVNIEMSYVCNTKAVETKAVTLIPTVGIVPLRNTRARQRMIALLAAGASARCIKGGK